MTAHASGIALPDREPARAINSEVGQRYLGCALANREILGHFARRIFAHNTCKSKSMWRRSPLGKKCRHRKGATRALRSRATRACPRRFVPSASPCWSAQHGDGLVHSGGLGDCRAVLATVADRAHSRHAALKQWSGTQDYR